MKLFFVTYLTKERVTFRKNRTITTSTYKYILISIHTYIRSSYIMYVRACVRVCDMQKVYAYGASDLQTDVFFLSFIVDIVKPRVQKFALHYYLHSVVEKINIRKTIYNYDCLHCCSASKWPRIYSKGSAFDFDNGYISCACIYMKTGTV